MRSRMHPAWTILMLCFLGILAAQGARLSFGAFLHPWEEDFRLDRSSISLVSTISFICYGLTQPLVGKLVDRYGVRMVLSLSVLLVGLCLILTGFAQNALQLTLIYAVIASLGFGGASGVAASVAVTEWFKTHRGLAFGIIEAGFGAGQLLLVPASLFLIEAQGWRSALWAIGLACVVLTVPLYVFLRSRPQDVKAQPFGRSVQKEEHQTPATPTETQTPEKTQRSPLLAWSFWGLALPFFICGISTTGMIDTHLVPFAHEHGYTTATTGATVSLLALFNILGTLASGPLADRMDNRKLLGGIYLVRALTLMLLPLLPGGSGWLMVFGILFGLVDFAVLAPTQVLAARYFQGHSVGVVFGMLSLAHQLGSALGAYLPGVLYVWTGNYNLAFVSTAVALILGSICSLLLPSQHQASKVLAPAS